MVAAFLVGALVALACVVSYGPEPGLGLGQKNAMLKQFAAVT